VVASAQQQIGPYQILGSLARGGMAELFVAQRTGVAGFAKQVVIKRVLPELARDRAFVDMFLAEARLAATLDHQNIVHVHDIGQDAGGYFLAMERLHGADVGAILCTVTRFGGELPPAIAIEIARSACAGLHHAHERRTPDGALIGLVHRDVSPGNLFVTFDGAVKLLDFGIAKAAQSTGPPQTRTGALRGKVPYMSPEQCNGEPLDRRSDVFSLSVVLWELTVGARLYGGAGEPELATMKAIADHDARRPSEHRAGYPAELERIVMRGLARDRVVRYQSADELQGELEAYARTAAAWSSAREMARFMAEVFPDRAGAWRDHERRGTVSLLVPGRQTTPLPPPPVTGVAPADAVPEASGTGGGSPPAPAWHAHAAAVPADVAGPPDPAEPARDAARSTAPRNAAEPSRTAAAAPARSKLAVVAVIAALVAAVVVGFAWGRARPASPSAADAADGSAVPGARSTQGSRGTPASAAGSARPGADPVTEDAMWFQSDDYLISAQPYRGERLDMLWVAKPLTPPPSPGAAAPFLDVNGEELTTEHYWRTRIATPADLTLGARAFCRVDSYLRTTAVPKEREESRTRPWMLGRVTDGSRLAAGEVSIANAICPLGAVRVSRDR
jgi:protein kinase-like protein